MGWKLPCLNHGVNKVVVQVLTALIALFYLLNK